MNYDELLSARDKERGTFSQMVIGKFTRRSIDGKYVNVVDIYDKLADNILFEEGLRQECKAVGTIKSPHQLKFMLADDTVEHESRLALVVERGVFNTLSQLLYDTPSLVARHEFVNGIIQQAFDALTALHDQGIYQVCLAPQNVLTRKGDNQLMLLSHGSFYLNLSDLNEFYGDLADFVAPEVISHGTVDERCDVFTLGKFIESLFSMSELPGSLKRVVRKATEVLPEDRYASLADMRKAISRIKSFRHTLLTLAAAVVVALAIVGAYFSMMPEQNEMEYVKPAAKEEVDEFLDEGFDPATELGFIANDTMTTLTPEQQKKLAEYEKKAETIFRKRFEREAERILSKVYNSSNMGVGVGETKFMTASQKAIEELAKVQEEIDSQTAISGTKSQRIASEIIEKVANAKKKAMTKK